MEIQQEPENHAETEELEMSDDHQAHPIRANNSGSFKPSVQWNTGARGGIRTSLRKTKIASDSILQGTSSTLRSNAATLIDGTSTPDLESESLGSQQVRTQGTTFNDQDSRDTPILSSKAAMGSPSGTRASSIIPENIPLPESYNPTHEHSEVSRAVSLSSEDADSLSGQPEPLLNIVGDYDEPPLEGILDSKVLAVSSQGKSELDYPTKIATSAQDSNHKQSKENSKITETAVPIDNNIQMEAGSNLSAELPDNASSDGEEGEVIESDSEEDSMLLTFSDSKQPSKPVSLKSPNDGIEVIDLDSPTGSMTSDSREITTSGTGPQTLAELTPIQLDLQVRYFYIGRDPMTIPETDPVHCTICSTEGHLAPWCRAQICEHCKGKGIHFSKYCPTIARCERCRGRHSVVDCKHKLKPQNLKIVCDLCHENDHVEVDCELTWRSSGPLWKIPLPKLSVAKTCFNCGDSGHLGNDCKLRQPGKPMGSSMWSAAGLPNPLTPLDTSAGRIIPVATGAKKSKPKMPNIKGKNVAASSSIHTPSTGTFPPNIKAASKSGGNKSKGKPVPGSIQIKGLAVRGNPGVSTHSQPRSLGGHQITREKPSMTPNSFPGTNRQQHPTPNDRNFSNDKSNGFPRGRGSRERYRSRSRSRSPKGWYQAPPRSAGYGPPARDYRDRDDPRHSNRDSWRPGGQ